MLKAPRVLSRLFWSCLLKSCRRELRRIQARGRKRRIPGRIRDQLRRQPGQRRGGLDAVQQGDMLTATVSLGARGAYISAVVRSE